MEPADAVPDDVAVRSDGTHDGRNADPEILDGFHRALAPRPRVVEERHDADVHRPQILDLGLRPPRATLHVDAFETVVLDADHEERKGLLRASVRSAPSTMRRYCAELWLPVHPMTGMAPVGGCGRGRYSRRDTVDGMTVTAGL